MKVALEIDPARLRRWHRVLEERLSERIEAAWLAPGPAAGPLPASTELLLRLERMVFGVPEEGLSQPAAPLGRPSPEASADLRLRLEGPAPAPGDGAWALLFDGEPGDAALFDALLAGRSPTIEVAGPDGVHASGVASLEAARGLAGAYEAVAARAVSLVLRALSVPGGTPVAPLPRPQSQPRPARHALASLSHAMARRLYHVCARAPHWRVGWRIVDDEDVWSRGGLGGPAWQVLADPGVRFYADPFPFVHEGRRHVFVEDLDHRVGRGVISCVEVGPEGAQGEPVPVLEEAGHLSYPFVFRHDGAVWMIPETSDARRVSLYRAAAYPTRWVREADLLVGVEASDATVIRHEGRWWMFATVRDGAGSHSDMLHVHHAADLRGPWRPHAGNPVLVDRGAARPAGPMLVRDGRLWRPAQDCSRGYGAGLALAEVTTLTPDRFEQAVRRRIGPGGPWPGRRLHTLARDGDLECIDGSAHSWRWRGAVTSAPDRTVQVASAGAS